MILRIKNSSPNTRCSVGESSLTVYADQEVIGTAEVVEVSDDNMIYEVKLNLFDANFNLKKFPFKQLGFSFGDDFEPDNCWVSLWSKEIKTIDDLEGKGKAPDEFIMRYYLGKV